MSHLAIRTSVEVIICLVLYVRYVSTEDMLNIVSIAVTVPWVMWIKKKTFSNMYTLEQPLYNNDEL